MNTPSLPSETVHTSCVAIDGRAVLIGGRSGKGKSDLALRLIDRGASLVADDYTLVRQVEGRLLASPPDTISGKIEVRGVGILEFPVARDVPIALYVDLDLDATRMPVVPVRHLVAGVEVPAIGLSALEASAPIKVEAALRQIGS